MIQDVPFYLGSIVDKEIGTRVCVNRTHLYRNLQITTGIKVCSSIVINITLEHKRLNIKVESLDKIS